MHWEHYLLICYLLLKLIVMLENYSENKFNDGNTFEFNLISIFMESLELCQD